MLDVIMSRGRGRSPRGWGKSETERRKLAAQNYGKGMAKSPTGWKNMYIYGGSVLSLVTFILGLARENHALEAFLFVIEYYIWKLVPWPIGEILMFSNFIELIAWHAITIFVGLFFATGKYYINNPNY